MRQHVCGQKRLLARSAIEYRNLGGASAKPRAEPRGIVTRQLLRDESSANTGKHVAHSAGRHSGIAGRVVAERMMTFRDNCAAAFEEKSYRIFPAKAFRNLRPRLLLPQRRFVCISPGCGVSNRGPLQRFSAAALPERTLSASASTTIGCRAD